MLTPEMVDLLFVANLVAVVIYFIFYLYYVIPAIGHFRRQPDVRNYFFNSQSGVNVTLAIGLATLILIALVYSLYLGSVAGLIILLVTLIFIWWTEIWRFRSPAKQSHRKSKTETRTGESFD